MTEPAPELAPDMLLRAEEAHDYMLALGDFSARFARVDRAPRQPDGRRETDVEHSFHLGLTAVELAAQYYPELNTGLVAEFSLVHDAPEVYTGDIWTFQITDEQRARKEAAEKEATERLLKEVPPHTAELIERYERQQEPEARFVRLIDKMVPPVMNVVAGDASTFKADYNVRTADAMERQIATNTERLKAEYPEFEFMHIVRVLVYKTCVDHQFPDRISAGSGTA